MRTSECRDAELARAKNDSRLAGDGRAQISVVAERLELPSLEPDRAGHNPGGVRADHHDAGKRVAHVAELHVLREDELIELCEHGIRFTSRPSDSRMTSPSFYTTTSVIMRPWAVRYAA